MATTSVPVFDAVLPSDLEAGVTAISLVLNPAIQHPFVALRDEPVTPARVHLSVQPMKQVVTGPALVPDQPIFRLSGDNRPYYIRFTADTIEALSRRFAASGNLAKTTDEHAIALQGNHVVESWIVTDPARDKSAALGLTVPQGTWMLSVHIPDTTYWNAEIVSGNRTGFSIEAMLDLADQTLFTAEPQTPAPPTNVSKNKQSLLARLQAFTRALFLNYEQLADGTGIEIDDTTHEVFAVDADGNRTALLPDGDYTLADGTAISVKDGKHVEAPVAEEAPIAAAAEVPVEQAVETPSTEPAAVAPTPEVDTLRAELDALRTKIDELDAARTSLMATNAELQTQLAAQPAAKPIKLAAAATTDEMTPAQRRLARAQAMR